MAVVTGTPVHVAVVGTVVTVHIRLHDTSTTISFDCQYSGDVHDCVDMWESLIESASEYPMNEAYDDVDVDVDVDTDVDYDIFGN